MSGDIVSHSPRPSRYRTSASSKLAKNSWGHAVVPWTSLTPSCESFNRNTAKDYIGSAHVTDWAADFTTQDRLDEFSQPSQADSAWWESVPVERILITGGTDEVLIDDIVTIGERIKDAAKGTDTELVITQGEVHIEFIMDAQLGLKPGAMAQAIWQWLERIW